MKLVAVTACPTGIAHTYMAAERLEKTGRKMGLAIKVETQGAMGIENELTAADIAAADAVILAVGIPVLKKERFAGKTIFEVPVQDALKNAEAILQRIKGELGL
ncbi:MAG: PTS fructose-like transporter subunit IIB [Acidobacteriota bacterium]|nr:PTS fructose-like transporter subunit IIB [Acidobacteriota bacterium]